jgi:hypothetical protein
MGEVVRDGGCGSCHVGYAVGAVNPGVHLNGFADVSCDGCHPAAPHGADAASLACASCHGYDASTLHLSGGTHNDGEVQGGGHTDYTEPGVHAPQLFASLAGAPGALDCKDCHGQSYEGGSGPSCNECHASTAGWTGWQTNCSFCHGARNDTTKRGYSVAANPEWSAPPDDLTQRLTGTSNPARAGAHQAHLTGVSSSGRPYAARLPCATCHTVPGDLAHAGGTGRAPVALSAAGHPSLPQELGSYDRETGTCTTYCHGSTLTDGGAKPPPTWGGAAVSCGASCHGAPPDSGGLSYDWYICGCARRDPVTDRCLESRPCSMHYFHYANVIPEYGWGSGDCIECHSQSLDAVWNLSDLHVDGVKDVSFAQGGTWNRAASDGAGRTQSCDVTCHPGVRYWRW